MLPAGFLARRSGTLQRTARLPAFRVPAFSLIKQLSPTLFQFAAERRVPFRLIGQLRAPVWHYWRSGGPTRPGVRHIDSNDSDPRWPRRMPWSRTRPNPDTSTLSFTDSGRRRPSSGHHGSLGRLPSPRHPFQANMDQPNMEYARCHIDSTSDYDTLLKHL